MRMIQKVIGVFAAFMFIFAWLLTSFEVAMYSDYGWYENEYEKYDVMTDLSMEIDDVMGVTHEMMDYLRGDRADLVVYTTIDGTPKQEFFNEQDKLHMADVRNLFVGGLRLRWLALILMAVSLIALAIMKADWKRILPSGYWKGLGISAILTAATGVYFAVDFSRAFTKFHEIFFTNDLWLFDPATDYMIRMLPENFFSDMVARIGILFIGGLAVVLLISVMVAVREKQSAQINPKNHKDDL